MAWHARCAWADWQAERDLQRLRALKMHINNQPAEARETLTVWVLLLVCVLGFAVGYITRDEAAVAERADLQRRASLVRECTPPAAPAPAPLCNVVETVDHCQQCQANWLSYGVLDKRSGR